MKRYMVMISLIPIVLACCTAGCKEKFHTDPPVLEGDELIVATALRRHMSNHAASVDYDYKYVFLSLYGEDPDRDFMDFFSDLFQEVLPVSKMEKARYGLENLPETRGVWIYFDVTEFTPVSGQEGLVTCRSYEYQKENPAVKYRMQLVDGRWKATSIMNIESGRILQ